MMVALLVSLLVVLAASLYYVAQAQNTVVSHQTTMMMEDGRLSLDILARRLRGAGDYGCSDPSQMINELSSTVLNITAPVMGYTAGTTLPTGTSPWGASNFAAINAISDVLVLNGASNKFGTLSQAMGSATDSPVVVSPSTAFAVGDVAIVTNCTANTLFQVTGVSANGGLLHVAGGSLSPGNASASVGNVFGIGSEVLRVDTQWLAVGTPSGKPKGLWLFSGQDHTAILISPLVINMKVQYLVDTNADGVGDTLQTAGSVSNWTNVYGVKVSLLLRSSQKGLVKTPMTYTFNGTTSTASDTYWYMPVDETVMLRNPAGGT